MAQWDDSENPYDQPYPTPAPASPLPGGPVTDPHDPRLSDPAYASDPNVLAFLNSIYGPGGTVYNKPTPTSTWDPQAQGWNPEAPRTPDPSTPPPAPAPGPAPAAGPAPGPTAAPQAPVPNSAPGYGLPPAFQRPPAFSYDPFNAPTGNDVLNDPSYQFELGQGMQAIGAKNAALGTLNTGGTIKDFQSFGQNLASTKYGELFNRKLTTHQTNLGNALDAYNTNYGTQYKDPYLINYQTQYADPFANQMASAGLNQNNQQFNASLGQNSNQFNASLDWQKLLQNYKASVTDPFDQKYRLLGLL